MPHPALITDSLIPGSRFFKWSEALWLPRMRAYAKPSLVQEQNIIKQAAALDKIRLHFGKPMTVHSWLRPEEYNLLIGGAKASQHMNGSATDFSIAGIDCEEIRKEIISKHLYPGRGEYGTPTWVHLDLAGHQWFWPNGSKKT